MSDYSTPKENWLAVDVPGPSDLIRMERNARANHEDLAAEAITRGDADTAEIAARIAADALKQDLPSAASGFDEQNYPVGTTVFVYVDAETSTPTINQLRAIHIINTHIFGLAEYGPLLNGGWRCRGFDSPVALFQRVS
jgi:hypothetical protein